jgi:predicted transcriptional regulator YheO
VNYELNIGAPRLKCTAIPIVRNGSGVVGAICINTDINCVRDEVLKLAAGREAG